MGMRVVSRQPPMERRKAPRAACSGLVDIHPYPADVDERPIKVKCRDISRTGIGLSHSRPLTIGGQFAIVMNEPEPTVILFSINRCSANHFGSYDVGARVLQVLRGRQVAEHAPGAPSGHEAFMRGLLMCAALK